MTKHFRSRYPRYPDDSDYKTNASSYYDDLARKNKLIEILAEKIYGYEKVLAENLAEIERVLNAVIDKIGEGFNQEIVELLEQWILDGTLDHIINETLMNKKADKTELEALEIELTKRINAIKQQVETDLGEFRKLFNEDLTAFKEGLNEEILGLVRIVETVETGLNDLEKETEKKFDYLVKDLNMYQLNLQRRHQSSPKSFTSTQGAAFISGEGYNINYALTFLPTDDNYENHAVIVNANTNSLISETAGTPLPLGHANGMDFNPETNSFYVSHANKQHPTAGNSPDNRVSEVSRDGSRLIRVIEPKGIPSGRRVKYFSYDKVTGKKYLGDDYGFYEVDNELNVLEVIPFSDSYLNYKTWGLAQSTAVHNGYLFLIVGSPWTIAVFDMAGKLLRLYKVPKFTKDGFYTGAHPQALFFDNEANLYMTSNTDNINYDLTKFHTRIFKMSPFTDEAEEHFLGTHNPRTPNYLYVTANPKNPYSLGSKNYPFHSIEEAIIYAQASDTQKAFQNYIWLDAGLHAGVNILTNGLDITITGDPGAVVEGMRFYDTNVSLEGFKIIKGQYNYPLMFSKSTVFLNKMEIDGLNESNYGFIAQAGSTVYAAAGSAGRNSIVNTEVGMYVTASQAIGSEYNFGVDSLTTSVIRSSSGYTPLMSTGNDE